MKYRFFALCVACVSVLSVLPLASEAHLAGGEDATVGEYVIDFGYDPAPPEADEPILLAFDVHDATTLEEIAFTKAWVRISDDEEILSAVEIAQNDSGTNESYTFPHAGNYTVHVRFMSNDSIIVETDYVLAVDEAPASNAEAILENTSCSNENGNINTGVCPAQTSSGTTRLVYISLVSLILGVLIGFGIQGMRKRNSVHHS